MKILRKRAFISDYRAGLEVVSPTVPMAMVVIVWPFDILRVALSVFVSASRRLRAAVRVLTEVEVTDELARTKISQLFRPEEILLHVVEVELRIWI